MIKESGRYEFDENLEEYIDFEQYGVDKVPSESGRFPDNGCIVYRGYSHEIGQVLRGNISLEMQNDYAPQELKLYTPQQITTKLQRYTIALKKLKSFQYLSNSIALLCLNVVDLSKLSTQESGFAKIRA